MKRCTHCLKDKPLFAYTKERSRQDGLFTWCSECKSENRKAAYMAARPDCRARKYEKPTGHATAFKLCIDCLEEMPVSHFHRKRSAADGKTPYCKDCGHARSIAWQKKNKEKLASKRLTSRQASPRASLNVSLNGALKRRPSENPMTLDGLMNLWRAQNGKCALSGVGMTWAQGKLLPTSITIDRIDQSCGYSIDNVRLLCHAVNSFRGLMSDAEMLVMAKAIVVNMTEKLNEPTWETFPEPRRFRAWPIEGAEAT